jgi:glycosyltransferase involved in cell wall biosynthesis
VNDELLGSPAAPTADVDISAKIGDVAAAAGLRRIGIVAWRDLEHPEAGGSEVHAARIAERWAAAGIDVSISTSTFPGSARKGELDGYEIRRLAGRYAVFPVAGAMGILPGARRPDGVVEVWNGMPFFSPVWARRPRAVFLHHVHGGMWDIVLPPALAALGKLIERKLAPPLYRRTPIVTLSDSSRDAIVGELGFTPDQVHVVPPGVDERFCPGSVRSQDPLVVAVGRLVHYKRFDVLVEVLVGLRERHPRLRAVIAGEGSERTALEEQISRHGAGGWISLPGRIDDDALADLYRSAWVLMSTSAYEGWGLTITEAAACGTPAVVSPIGGHVDAVTDGFSGLLAKPGAEMESAVHRLLSDELLRHRLQRGAIERARLLTWDRAAVETLSVLASDARRRDRAG